MVARAAVGFVLCAAVASASCAGSGGAWMRLQPADFPARVSAILFPGGQRLDAKNDFLIGAWRVQAKGPLSATGYFGHYGGVSRIDVSGLTCLNKVVGQVPCRLHLQQRPATLIGQYEGPPCFLSLGHRPPLAVECPADLVLER